MATPAQQAATAFQLRSNFFHSMEIVAGANAPAGAIAPIEDTIGIVVQDAAIGETVALVYFCPKVLVPKQTGTGRAIAVGESVYADPTEQRVSDAGGTGTILVGRALEAAADGDATVLIHFDGMLTQPADD